MKLIILCLIIFHVIPALIIYTHSFYLEHHRNDDLKLFWKISSIFPVVSLVVLVSKLINFDVLGDIIYGIEMKKERKEKKRLWIIERAKKN